MDHIGFVSYSVHVMSFTVSHSYRNYLIRNILTQFIFLPVHYMDIYYYLHMGEDYLRNLNDTLVK